jgi:hypothetical protein
MDKRSKTAQEIFDELQQDYGSTSAMKVEDVANMMEDKISHESIEQAYRQFRMMRKDTALDKLNALRDLFGRCDLVKENDVLGWIDANDTAMEMEVKYRRAVRNEGRMKEIDTQLKSTARSLGTAPTHNMNDIMNALKSHGQESDAQIAVRVSTVVQSRFNIT